MQDNISKVYWKLAKYQLTATKVSPTHQWNFLGNFVCYNFTCADNDLLNRSRAVIKLFKNANKSASNFSGFIRSYKFIGIDSLVAPKLRSVCSAEVISSDSELSVLPLLSLITAI